MTQEEDFADTICRWKAIIEVRCPRCLYGARDLGDIRCWHHYHPGTVGGAGTASSAQCVHFVDTCKMGRIVRTSIVVRDGPLLPPMKEEEKQ